MSQQWKKFKQLYYRNLKILSSCSPLLLSGNVHSEHVAATEGFKQRYYQNINTLSICRPVLLAGNFQSENVAVVERVQTTILLEN